MSSTNSEPVFISNSNYNQNSNVSVEPLNPKEFNSETLTKVNVEDKLPIEQSFCVSPSGNEYSVLVSKEFSNIEKSSSNKLQIFKSGIYNKIVLVNFPLSTYILSINSNNCASSKYDDLTKTQYFDFTSKSELLKNYIDNKKNIILDNLFTCYIIVPKAIKLNHIHELKFITSDLKEELVQVYPYNTYKLSMNNVTESLLINMTSYNIKCNLQLYLNDKLYKNIDAINTGYINIRLIDSEMIYQAKQNTDLSDDINKNTLNLSPVHNIYLICNNCDIKNITQYYYETYYYNPMRYIKYLN